MRRVSRWAGLACLLGSGIAPLLAHAQAVPIALRGLTGLGCLLLLVSGPFPGAARYRAECRADPTVEALSLLTLSSAALMFALAFLVPLGATAGKWAMAAAALIALLSMAAESWKLRRA